MKVFLSFVVVFTTWQNASAQVIGGDECPTGRLTFKNEQVRGEIFSMFEILHPLGALPEYSPSSVSTRTIASVRCDMDRGFNSHQPPTYGCTIVPKSVNAGYESIGGYQAERLYKTIAKYDRCPSPGVFKTVWIGSVETSVSRILNEQSVSFVTNR